MTPSEEKLVAWEADLEAWRKRLQEKEDEYATQSHSLQVLKGALEPFANQANSHKQIEDPPYHPYCSNCGEEWPCDFVNARDALQSLGKER